MSKIYQLVYYSQASFAFKGHEDVANILKRANEFNTAHDITGVLIYNAGIFIQLLEGDKEKVTGLFNRIEKDERHKEVGIIFKQESDSRIFEKWSMAYRKIDEYNPEVLEEINKYSKFIEDHNEEINEVNILELLHLVKETF